MAFRPVFSILGAAIGCGAAVAINLLSNALQDKSFLPLGTYSIVWLAVLGFAGLLLGNWLGQPVAIQSPENPSGVKVTRLTQIFSGAKIFGTGVAITDTKQVGSSLHIDTRGSDSSTSKNTEKR